MGCRKNLTTLSPAERQAFTNAVRQLDTNGEYQKYVDMHQGAGGHGHGGPAFFAWHRHYVRQFELDLQAIDPSVSVPYWDWTSDNLNTSGTESLIWREDFMGGPGEGAGAFTTGPVNDGPFADWGLQRKGFDIFGYPGTGGTIATHMANPDYDGFRAVEGPHGAAHVWVGGNVSSIATAPSDPVFWLIHSNVDRLWAEWIDQHEATAGFEPYKPASGGPTGHNLNDTMWPWNGTTSPWGMLPWTVSPDNTSPADLTDHAALGYHYDTVDPVCQGVRPKFFKENQPPEVVKGARRKEVIKDVLPKENRPKEVKELLPKELVPDNPKRLLPKEADPKELAEVELPGVDPFIATRLRPDLRGAALRDEPDVAALRAELLRRRGGGL